MQDRAPRTISRRNALSVGAAGVAAMCLGCSSGSGGASDSGAADRQPPPEPGAGVFGDLVAAGTLDHVRRAIAVQKVTYVPEARTYLAPYPAERVAAAKTTYPALIHAGLDAGLLALYQKCTHMGCRIPFCFTADEFQCPCHDSVYSLVGEYRSGPAPRGLDLFPIVVVDDKVWIDTGRYVRGLPQPVSPSGLARTGPSCI